MKITNADILEYQQLSRDKLGVDLSREQAATELRALVDLMQIVYQPITTDQYKQIQLRRSELGLPHKPIREGEDE